MTVDRPLSFHFRPKIFRLIVAFSFQRPFKFKVTVLQAGGRTKRHFTYSIFDSLNVVDVFLMTPR